MEEKKFIESYLVTEEDLEDLKNLDEAEINMYRAELKDMMKVVNDLENLSPEQLENLVIEKKKEDYDDFMKLQNTTLENIKRTVKRFVELYGEL